MNAIDDLVANAGAEQRRCDFRVKTIAETFSKARTVLSSGLFHHQRRQSSEPRHTMIHTNCATERGRAALLAESSATRYLAIKGTFESSCLQERLVRVPTGMDVLDYLHGNGDYGEQLNCPLPNLLLLGQNLPVLSEIAVLCCLRSESRFERLPIIMVSNSFTRAQIVTANWMGAACCRQPDSAEDLTQAITHAVRLALRPEKENESLSHAVLNPNGPCFPQARRSSDNLLTLSLGEADLCENAPQPSLERHFGLAQSPTSALDQRIAAVNSRATQPRFRHVVD